MIIKVLLKNGIRKDALMYTYSMMPLDGEHFEETLLDIKEQHRTGVCDSPMFIMTLVPEGDPVWDKVGPMCDLFEKFRKETEKDGIPLGILIQASLGHGYKLVPAPFDKYVNLTDGKTEDIYCPLDRRFVEHFKDVLKRIARARPSAIMLDDDFRLMMRGGRGCACKRHLAELEKRTGRRFTREELWRHICENPESDPVTCAFRDLQRDTLVDTARSFREAIDEIDPTIQGINCTSGDVCEAVEYTSKVFAGKGNPSVVRVPNGTYAPQNVKGFSDTMRAAAVCKAKLKRAGVDVILAETDTIPFNRYGKNARYLHSHYTASILEGLRGAKHWLTRTSSFEPKSGRAFRRVLSEHSAFYERLAELTENITWVGVNSFFIEQKHFVFNSDAIWRYHASDWTAKVFERIGIPFYFSDRTERASLLNDGMVKDMTDEQIRTLFDGSVLMTSDAAEALIGRGYGDLLGVEVSEWTGDFITGEMYGSPSLTSTKQKGAKRLIPTAERTEELSHCFKKQGMQKVKLFPAVTAYEREAGRLSVVFCGTPNAEHNYMEGFAFLTETRKKQFVELLKRCDALPIYYDGDAEMCVRAGHVSDGRLLAAFFNLGFDPLETLPLYIDGDVTEITRLDKDGKECGVSFTRAADGAYELDVRCEPMYPLVVMVKTVK